MYCAHCGKEIVNQGEGGYCEACEAYTATPTPLKPQKNLTLSNQLLYMVAFLFGIIAQGFCIAFNAYHPSKGDLEFVLLCYLLALVPFILTCLIYIRELGRNIDQSNLFLLAIPCLIMNTPLIILSSRLYKFFFAI